MIHKAAAIIFSAIFPAAACAHSWYPAACCNELDCKPVPVENVEIIDGQYLVTWGGQTIASDKANPSPDGQFHICTSQGAANGAVIYLNERVTWPSYEPSTMPRSNVCFWAPFGT